MELSHIDDNGNAKMVNVGDKQVTRRYARAAGKITMSRETLNLVKEGKAKKGDVLTVAKIAGVEAAKNCGRTIPLCHNIFLSFADVVFRFVDDGIEIEATVEAEAKTGVEMEALSAVAAAALTIYDMVKAADKEMVIGDIRLIEKLGGKSGDWKREERK